ncbi:MAG: TonB-dependent receptor [Balneolaceae bacterium]
MKSLLLLAFTLIFSSTSMLSQTTDSLDIYDKLIMERVTILGKPAWMDRTPGSASYIGYAELQKQNYSDVNRVLRSISGVNIQEEDGFGLRPNIGLRGTGVERSSKITLMEDGVLIAPAPYAAPAAYYFPSIGRMSSVEVRKGSSQIKYGPLTTGGALNMISTQIPYELSGNAEVSTGQFNSRKIHATVGSTYKNFGFLLESYQLSNDGFKDLDFGGRTGFDTKDFLGKVMFRSNTSAKIYQKVEFKFGYYDELSDETYLGLSDSDFEDDPFRRYAGSQVDLMDADQTHLSVRHFAQFSANFDITTTIYRNNFNRNWYKLDKVDGVGISSLLANPSSNLTSFDIVRGSSSIDDALSVKANNREYYSRGIQSILASSFELAGTTSELEFGIRYHEDGMDRFQWVDGYRMEDGTMILTSEGTPGTDSNRIESATALALFIQDKITFKQWTFTPGLRYENIALKREDFGKSDSERAETNLTIRENDISVLVPGMGINYLLTTNLNLFGGIHKGFAPPSPGAASGTSAENSVNYEIGSRFNNNKLNLEVVGFFNNYSNLLGSDLSAGGGSGTSSQFNAGEVDVLGLEVSLGWNTTDQQNKLQIPFSLNYTYTSATFQNSFISDFEPWGEVSKGDEMPYLPKHQINLSTSFIYKKVDLNLNTHGTSAMRTVAGSGSIQEKASTDSYFLMDFSIGYQLNTTANFFVDIRNITDKTYIVSRRPAGVRPGLPRMLIGGVKLNF